MLKRQFAIVYIIMIFIVFLIVTSLLIQVYATHEPIFFGVTHSVFESKFEILGYSSLLLLIGGFLALIIALNLSIIFVENKKISYISASLGTILVFLSFGLSLISRKPEQEWLGFFSMVTLGTGLITMTFYKLVTIERSSLSRSLKLISYILLLVGVILNFLKISQ